MLAPMTAALATIRIRKGPRPHGKAESGPALSVEDQAASPSELGPGPRVRTRVGVRESSL